MTEATLYCAQLTCTECCWLGLFSRRCNGWFTTRTQMTVFAAVSFNASVNNKQNEWKRMQLTKRDMILNRNLRKLHFNGAHSVHTAQLRQTHTGDDGIISSLNSSFIALNGLYCVDCRNDFVLSWLQFGLLIERRLRCNTLTLNRWHATFNGY